MILEYENINHDENLPIKIFLHNIRKSSYHWHTDLELIFILKGNINIVCNKITYVLSEKDVFLINGNEIHAIEASEDNQTLFLQIDRGYFEKVYPNFKSITFKVDSTVRENDKASFDQLRQLIAQIMDTVNKKEEGYTLFVNKLLFDLVCNLIKRFVLYREHEPVEKKDDKDRIKAIMNYIMENYNWDIGLNEIAEYFHLSRGHLSRYFSEQVGISLMKYVNEVRLKKSIQLLLNTNINVTDIAFECGFTYAKSYFEAFRKAYHVSPAEYRKLNIQNQKPELRDYLYFNINKESAFQSLYEFLSMEKYSDNGRLIASSYHCIEIDISKTKGNYKNAAFKLGTFDRVAEGLRSKWKEQFTEIQKDIRFEYMRLRGIFNDEMMVYNETTEGIPYYNFVYVDEVLDFLLEHNARPFIEIGYMPWKLSSGDRSAYQWQGNITPPKDIKRWLDLVKAFLKHLITRYGSSEVRKWYFQIWSDPDSGDIYWAGTREEYIRFYIKTFEVIKHTDSGLKVGGPGINLLSVLHYNWVEWFEKECSKSGIIPDFFSFHAYNLEIYQNNELPNLTRDLNHSNDTEMIKIRNSYYHMGDSEVLTENINKVIKILDGSFVKGKEVIITQWNISSSSRDLIHDTCYMATYIAKNILSFGAKVDGLGYWAFTDIFEETGAGLETFHGGFGLITQNGIKKPHYHVYQLLRKLKGEIVYQGNEGIVLLAQDGVLRIMLFNYCHYDDLYDKFDTSGITMLQRYNCFKSEGVKNTSFVIHNIHGKYQMIKYSISRKKGSSYDAWIKMGAPVNLSKAETEYLKYISHPDYQIKEIFAEDEITIDVALDEHEVVLYELLPL